MLTPEEVRLAREARAAVGRAIRDARRRRAEPAYLQQTGTVIPFPRDGQPFRRAMLGLAAFTVIALLVVIFGLPNLRESPAPAAAAPEIPKPVVTLSPAGGRGRTSVTPAPVAAVPIATPEPTPAPTETPLPATPAPAASEATAPVASSAPVTAPATGGQPGGVSGGVAGGTPGGVVGGTPGGTGTRPIGGGTPPTPAPSYIPAGTPPPQPQGSNRFYFKVIDSSSRAPLQNICVSYGLIQCVYTNAMGLYWIDVDPNDSRWQFSFTSDVYWPTNIVETYQPGMGSVPTTVYLRHK